MNDLSPMFWYIAIPVIFIGCLCVGDILMGGFDRARARREARRAREAREAWIAELEATQFEYEWDHARAYAMETDAGRSIYEPADRLTGRLH